MNYYKIAGITFALSGFEYEYFKDRMKSYEVSPVASPDVTVYYEQALFPINKPDYKHIVTTGGFREYYSDGGGYIFYDKFETDSESCAKVEINADASVVHTALFDIEYIGGAPVDVRCFNMLGEVFRYCILKRNGMVVHSSSISHDGNGIIFSAPSGTGKSTHTSLWMKYYGENTQMINDDCPAITFDKEFPYVNGTPWSGKTNINFNISAPLRAVVLLQQEPENKIQRISVDEAVFRLLHEVTRPAYKDLMNKTLANIEKIVTSTPVYLLGCTIDKEAVDLVRRII